MSLILTYCSCFAIIASMNNEYKQTIPDSSEKNPWLMEVEARGINKLQAAASMLGAVPRLEDDETVLISEDDTHVRGFAFADGFMVRAAFRKEDGDTTHGICVGMTEAVVKDDESGEEKIVPAFAVVYVTEDGEVQSAVVPIEQQAILQEELESKHQSPEEEMSESYETIIDGLSQADINHFEAFAQSAFLKKKAQERNDGNGSDFYSGLMGSSLKSMGVEARQIAEEYARQKYGEENVVVS